MFTYFLKDIRMFSSAGDNGGEDEEGKSPLGKSYSNLGIYWRKKEKSSKAQTKREIKKKRKFVTMQEIKKQDLNDQ